MRDAILHNWIMPIHASNTQIAAADDQPGSVTAHAWQLPTQRVAATFFISLAQVPGIPNAREKIHAVMKTTMTTRHTD